jgi:dihydrofolate synthase/folylpolyglutamate synthase
VVTSERRESVAEVLQGVADQEGCRFYTTAGRSLDPAERYGTPILDLPGEHQLENGTLAVRVTELLFGDEEGFTEAVKVGLRRTRNLAGLRARCEVLREEPLIIADVAHNPDGLAATLKFVESQRIRSSGRLFVLFGVMRDKDVESMVRQLVASNAVIFPANLNTHRSLEAIEIARALHRVGGQCPEYGTVAEGLRWFERNAKVDDCLLIVGSHYLVGALPEHLFPTLEQPEDRLVT